MPKSGSQFLCSFAERKSATAALEQNSPNEVRSKTKFTEGKGHLTGEAKFVHCWGDGRGWWEIFPPPYMLKDALLYGAIAF